MDKFPKSKPSNKIGFKDVSKDLSVYEKSELVNTGKNFDDCDNLLEKNILFKAKPNNNQIFIPKQDIIPQRINIKKFQKLDEERDIVNPIKHVNTIITENSQKRQKNKFSNNFKLSIPTKKFSAQNIDILQMNKLMKENKLKEELKLYEKRKAIYNRELILKNEDIDKSKKPLFFVKKKLVNIYLNKIKFYTTMIFLFVFVNLTLNVADISMFTIQFNNYLELLLKPNVERINVIDMKDSLANFEISSNLFLIRMLNYCIIFIIDIFVVLLHSVEVDIKIYYRIYEDKKSIFSWEILKKLMLEIAILSIFLVPDYVIITKYVSNIYLYPINGYFCLFSTVKIYVIFNMIFLFSKWRQNSNLVICNKYKVIPNLNFVNIAMFKQNLIVINLIILMFSCIYTGVLVWIFNVGIFDYDGEKYTKNDNYNIIICIYLIFQTCTTLGYGEYVNSSFSSKFIAISSVFWGWVSVSLIVVFAFKKVDFNEDELKAYYAYKKKEYLETTQQKAINLIKLFVRFNYLLKVKDPVYKFMFDDPHYDLSYFMSKRRKTTMSSSKLFNIIHDLKEKQKAVRFYNKVYHLMKLNKLCKEFYDSQRIWRCFLPSSDERMFNFIAKIDETNVRLNEFINMIDTVGKEFRSQLDESENNLKRLIRISQLQKKVGELFVRKNNINLMKKKSATVIL